MNKNELEQMIRRELPSLELLIDEPMSRHTSFKIGGRADILALPSSVKELMALFDMAYHESIEPVIIGMGSNILAPDKGIEGLVVKTRGLDRIKLLDKLTIEAECGAPLSRLSLTAAQNSLSGLEFAHGIPGSVGGAVVMNAGAYGGEIKDVCIETDVLCNGEIVTVIGEQQGFEYRKSALDKDGTIILKSRFRLEKKDSDSIFALMEEFSKKRRSSQPLDMPSAGSTFKRPEGGYAAALIEQAGLKGMKVGGAMVSEKHAGFVVNTGGATASDVIELIGRIQRAVYEFAGTLLEPEVRVL